jgi:hypothetical protein
MTTDAPPHPMGDDWQTIMDLEDVPIARASSL